MRRRSRRSGARAGREGQAAMRPTSLRPLHQVDEALEEIVAVLRAGARLRVILDGEDRLARAAQTLVAAVEERGVRDLDIRRQALGQHAEAVILAGDLDLAGGEVLDGMIGAAMPDRHLARAPAEGEGEELVS